MRHVVRSAWLKAEVVLGFALTDGEALVPCLGDPQRAVAAYEGPLWRNEAAMRAIRAGLRQENPAVREGCSGAGRRPMRWLTARGRSAHRVGPAAAPGGSVRDRAG